MSNENKALWTVVTVLFFIGCLFGWVGNVFFNVFADTMRDLSPVVQCQRVTAVVDERMYVCK